MNQKLKLPQEPLIAIKKEANDLDMKNFVHKCPECHVASSNQTGSPCRINFPSELGTGSAHIHIPAPFAPVDLLAAVLDPLPPNRPGATKDQRCAISHLTTKARGAFTGFIRSKPTEQRATDFIKWLTDHINRQQSLPIASDIYHMLWAGRDD